MAGLQEILSRTQGHRGLAEVLDGFQMMRCGLDDALDDSVTQRAIDGDALVGRTEKWLNAGPAPVRP